jgi:hypothetical protein
VSLESTNRQSNVNVIGDPAERHIGTQSPNLDPRSDRTFELIRNWLEECEHEHSIDSQTPCRGFSASHFPARVLDLGVHESYIKLISGKDLRGPYVTLSYCWGGEQPHALTLSNKDRYEKDIPQSTLPPSIQDAIFTTRKLGLRFLWVDSLCIIQDSITDKDSQMAHMGDVYGNAYLTISAASANCCHDGFLNMRKEQRCVVTLPFCCEDGDIGKISMWIRIHHEPRFSHGSFEPLDCRAWALQERFMSNRLLVFSQIQVFFMCGKSFGSDGGTIERLEYMSLVGNGGDLMRPSGLMSLNNELWSSMNPTEIRRSWIQIVKDFSTRKLSNPEDKLPAVSSIAAYSAGFNKDDKYHAGLWSSTLLEDLSWHKPSGKSLDRSKVWRCPSWSFMSVDGEISFFDHHHLNFHSLVEVQECTTKPASTEAPFGRVESGHLKLSGHKILVNPLKPIKGSEGIKFWQPQGRVTTPLGTLYYDTTKTSRSSQPFKVTTNYGKLKWNAQVWCLLIGTQKDYESQKLRPDDVPWGLVLARLESREYHRIGWFKGKASSLATFRAEAKKIVTIV